MNYCPYVRITKNSFFSPIITINSNKIIVLIKKGNEIKKIILFYFNIIIISFNINIIIFGDVTIKFLYKSKNALNHFLLFDLILFLW